MIRYPSAIVLFVASLQLLRPANTLAVDPKLSLYLSGTNTSSVSYSLQQLPGTISIDVHLDTALRSIDGLEFYLQASAPAGTTLTYAGAGVVGSPFTLAESQGNVAAGMPVNGSSMSSFYSQGLYAASADYNLMTHTINTSGLPAGTYVLSTASPILLTGAPNYTQTFATPSNFTLTVTVPEPGSLAAMGIVATLLRRRRRSA